MREPPPSRFGPSIEAAGLWRRYGFSTPADLVLEDLAYALGVLVLEAPLDTADARLLRKGSRGLIRVNRDIPEPGRKRFAVAHELGHWLLHKTTSQIIACTNEDMVARYKASPAEVEANYFAAELLMPERLFLPHVRGVSPTFDLIKQLASVFTTTLTATAVRLVELSDDYCAVVVSQSGRIKWWRGSDKFEEKCWIDAGTVLSERSVAAAYFSGREPVLGSEELDAEAWLARCPGGPGTKVVEQAIPLGKYGTVISLVRLA